MAANRKATLIIVRPVMADCGPMPGVDPYATVASDRCREPKRRANLCPSANYFTAPFRIRRTSSALYLAA